tara:strand:+ start:133 stop:597 length:465 start_codon:yes stop_codon:yes gene_type:complete
MKKDKNTSLKNERETRDESSRIKEWKPPSLLEAPPARPGYKQRWIATKILGVDNPTNWAKRRREGWEPRKPETIPGDFHAPTINHGTYQGYVGIEGMVLCEMPEEMVTQRNEYYQQKTDSQMTAVKNDLNRIEQPGNPIQRDHKSSVTRGGIKE